MSGRNRLLFWKDSKTSTCTIEEPSFTELFEALVESGTELAAPLPEPGEVKSVFDSSKDLGGPERAPKDRIRLLKPNEIGTDRSVPALNKVLSNLRYTSRTIQEEQGFNVLYATFGMLKWREAASSDFILAPLVLVPLEIEREGAQSPYRIRMAEDDIVINPVLQTRLAADFRIDLPEVSNDITSNQLEELLRTVSDAIAGLPDWGVVRQVTLGAFNFLTLLLIKDFEKYTELYCAHPLVRALSGIPQAASNAPIVVPSPTELDDVVDPGQAFEILDADSSQQQAIEAAKRGVSFVLQGPPGTGKSQTIANIIAEFLMAGKKVLFVSQKMAALEVVQDRLNRRKLGEYCLEVHSHKMDKRQVIGQLMRSLLYTDPGPTSTSYRASAQELKALREALNAYVRHMHEPRFEIGLSPYLAFGHLATLLDAPQVNFPLAEIERISSISLSKMLSTVHELARYSRIISNYKTDRWTGYSGVASSLQEREALASCLEEAASAIGNLRSQVRAITAQYGLPAPETIQDCLGYVDVLSTFYPGVFAPDLQPSVNNYISGYRSFWRLFNLKYWQDSAKLRSVFRAGTRPDPEVTAPVLKTVQKILTKPRPDLSKVADFGSTPPDVSGLRACISSITSGMSTARALFDSSNIPGCLAGGLDQAPAELTDWLRDHSQHTQDLAEWAQFNAVRQEAAEAGIGAFVSQALDTGLRAEHWERAFERRFYLLLSDAMLQDRPVLRKFRGTSQSEAIQRFRSLDLQLVESAPHEIRSRLNVSKPSPSWMQAASAETSILRREFNKKRRVMPLRKLFAQIPGLIQALKPCLMMSPLTVCQLLEPDRYEFDLVVFDEASQIPPEYAMGAFLRAKQVIVAGDRQQLPPTNFFHAIEADDLDDDDESETNESFESILNSFDSCGLPSLLLNWHYRSKDESLIVYSNHHFYDNRLYTFPSPGMDGEGTGLKFVFVKDGVYKRGLGARHNLREALAVAELVKEHLANSPELSLGIVAFSVSQRQAISDAIDLMLKENPDLAPLLSMNADEPLFIKNLENVQGDERDVIILSVGYAKDETGKMTLNFGPINREGGARRLNVAVTRARYSLKVVTSIEPEDIDPDRAASQGARLLRNYLEVARDGVKAAFKDEQQQADAELESPFEASVYQALTERGVQLVPQLGVSQYRVDFAVLDPQKPGRYLLGIECDGAMYHSAATARDRDRLRQQVLEGLGWKIHRIWSRDWIENRGAEIERVLEAIVARKREVRSARPDRKKKAESKKQPDPPAFPPDLEELAKSEAPAAPPGAVPYRRRHLKPQRPQGGDAVLNTSIHRLVQAFAAIVSAEGPISKQEAKYRVLDAWGARNGSRISRYLDDAISSGLRGKAFKAKGKFLWPMEMSVPPLRIFVDEGEGGDVRAIEEIAPEEIALAIRECVKSAIGILQDDLARETCRLFGLNATADAAGYVGSLAEQMVKAGILAVNDEKVTKGPKF